MRVRKPNIDRMRKVNERAIYPPHWIVGADMITAAEAAWDALGIGHLWTVSEDERAPADRRHP